MRNLEEKSRASPFLIKEEIRVVKGNTCLECHYFSSISGCSKNVCKLKIDEIYKQFKIYDNQLKLEL